MIRLLMADDHGIVREGLKRFFDTVEDIAVVGEAANGEQALAAVEAGGLDVLLLDMSMPGIGGVELIRRVRVAAPQLSILVLSMHHEPQIVKRALKAGANGYISKDTNDPRRLLAAIRQVAAGGRFLDPEMAERLAFDIDDVPPPLHNVLSERELQIFKLLALGLTVSEIAEQLFISGKTVSTHKARVMEKMNMKSTAQLVRYALSHSLLE